MHITRNADPLISPAIELTAEEARQGMTTGHMRYVLGISLTLIVLEMGIMLAM
ncbi:MAG: hypothetical protein ABL973_09910 [Micropepsaceae bacterium]